MSVSNYYPSLLNLLPVDKVPSELGTFKTALSGILGNIFYKNFQSQTSASGDAGFYSLSLVTFDKFGWDLPLNGFALLINPNLPGNNTSPQEIPVTLMYRWELLKFIDELDLTNFTGSADDFFDLILTVADVGSAEFLTAVIEELITPATIAQFVIDYNGKHPSETITAITGTDEEIIADLADQIQTDAELASSNIFARLFTDYITGTFQERLDKLGDVFSKWLGELDFDTVEDMLIPHVNVSFTNIDIGLEFPRSILIPLDQNGDPLPGVDDKTVIVMNVGTFTYDTKEGYTLVGENTISLPPSEIANTGFTLSATNMLFDLSDTKNIIYAELEGRDAAFKGVYIESLTISAPKNWSITGGTIEGTELLIGSEGGLSGKLGLGSGNLQFTAFGCDFDFSTLSIEFSLNSVVNAAITGTIAIPPFMNSAGTAKEPMGVSIGYDGTEYDFTLSNITPVKFFGVELVLNTLSGKFENNKLTEFTASADIKIDALKNPSTNVVEPIGVNVTYDEPSSTYSVSVSNITLPVKFFGMDVKINQVSGSFTDSTLTSLVIDATLNIDALQDNGSTADIGIQFTYSSGTYTISKTGAALPLKLGGVDIEIGDVTGTFSGSTLTNFAIDGSLKFEALRNTSSGNIEPIAVSISYTQTPSPAYSFALTSGNIPLKFFGLEMTVHTLNLGFSNTALTALSIGAKLKFDKVESTPGTKAEYDVTIGYVQPTFTLSLDTSGGPAPSAKIFGMDFSCTSIGVSYNTTANQLTNLNFAGNLSIPQMKEQGQSTAKNIAITFVYSSNPYLIAASLSGSPIATVEVGKFLLKLNSISISLNQTSLTQFAINGTVEHESLTNSSGTKLPVNFGMSYSGSIYSINVAPATAVNGTVPALHIKGLPITLDPFSVTFDDGGIISASAGGTIEIGDIEEQGSGTKTISIDLDIEDDGFHVSAGTTPPLELTIPGIVDFDLYQMGIGREPSPSGLWYITFGEDPAQNPNTKGLNADILLDVPVVGKFIPEKVLIHSLKIRQDATTDLEKIEFIWEAIDGLSVTGGGGVFSVSIPINKTILDVLTIKGFKIEWDATNAPSYAFLKLTMSGSVALGPFNGSITDIGVKIKVTPKLGSSNGNFGPFELGDYAITGPSGMGMSIDASAFKGGGYFEHDKDKGEYAGVLELTIYELVSVKAMGILNTKMPDGSKGFSLIIIISAEFTPIQIGFGFTLNGVGGLLGLHRTMVLDELRKGVRDGSIDNFMFPDDPVKNAPKIISDMRKVFPVHKGQFVFGPMGFIGWGTPNLITVKLGIAIEVPDPVRVAIMGVIQMALPDEAAPLIDIKVNFLGTFDSEAKLITFDAELYDSRIAFLGLSGSMAFRLGWGNNSVFILSIGGFHPKFKPPPVSLPPMNRLTITIINTSNLKLYFECYTAVTSNTFQIGARINAMAKAIGFKAEATIGFDALFQFSPFYFDTSIYGSASISFKGKSLFSVGITINLTGPSPYDADGKATFKFLGAKKNFHFHERWGDKGNAVYDTIDVIKEIEDALKKEGNWETTEISEHGKRVYLRKLTATAGTLIMDAGSELTVKQKIVPLGISVTKFGNQYPKLVSKYSLEGYIDNVAYTSSGDVSHVKDNFASTQYKELNNAQKLASPSFEMLKSGISVNPGGANAADFSDGPRYRAIVYDLAYHDFNENLIVPELPPWYDKLAIDATNSVENIRFQYSLKGSDVANCDAARDIDNKGTGFLDSQKVTVSEERYVVVNKNDLSSYNGSSYADSSLEANDYLDELLTGDPTLEGQLQVVPEYAVNV